LREKADDEFMRTWGTGEAEELFLRGRRRGGGGLLGHMPRRGAAEILFLL